MPVCGRKGALQRRLFGVLLLEQELVEKLQKELQELLLGVEPDAFVLAVLCRPVCPFSAAF